ncbi:energy transducer TonB [Catenovulum sediminis]|uniref:energy transducer TonB n=1 Tax=Catenovulum sediminis TaxID=1740262 RepID=UPI00117E7877|nr:energy transducer TonB [Catenovulum sediminis]
MKFSLVLVGLLFLISCQSTSQQPAKQTANTSTNKQVGQLGKLPVKNPPDLSKAVAVNNNPIIRVHPRYPVAASKAGQEGWVVLEFTINKYGGTDKIKIVDASPEGIFEKDAINALKKWKYKPKVIAEKGVAQPGQRVLIHFNL